MPMNPTLRSTKCGALAGLQSDSLLASSWYRSTPKQLKRTSQQRWSVIFVLIVLVTVCHWATPMTAAWMHAIHILLRKLFIVPILLGAIWLGFRGAIVSASVVSVVYAPYIKVAWSGQFGENLNQLGEIVTFWIVGLLAGWLATRERHALKRAADASRDALRALVAALDAREHQTEQHSHRVADMSLRIGAKLGLDVHELAVLHEGALLHDVGKIGVPDHVLLKPGPLTDDERRVMQRHAEMGYAILSAARHLRGVADLVHAHHERFDGAGYPRGLAGETIPLGARIFAVADVFDAVTSDRPYRSAMHFQDARNLVVEGSGSHFDPKVVAAFLAVVDNAKTGRLGDGGADPDGSDNRRRKPQSPLSSEVTP